MHLELHSVHLIKKCSKNDLTETFVYSLGIGTQLDKNLGQIEKVGGYIVIRGSASLTSLNFLKNLKEIEPKKNRIFFPKYEERIDLYNDRYVWGSSY